MSFPGEGQQRKAKGPRNRAETNVQFIRRLMEYSPYGALAQMFVIDAIDKWANHIGNMPPEIFQEAFKTDLIHPDAWQGVARDIAKQIRERT